MSTTERLGSFDVFSHLSAEQLELLSSCATRVRFPAGVTVLKEGDTSFDTYVVDKGVVRIKRETSYGEITLAQLGEGQLFGETTYIDHESRSMDVITDEDTELFLLSQVALAAHTDRDRSFQLALYWAFWRSLSQKLRETNDRLTRFFSEGAKPPERPDPLGIASGSFRLDMDLKRNIFEEQRLSAMEINFLASLSRERKVDAGETLFREGDEGTSMYIVLGGQVRISKNIPGAGEEALAILERGDYFGEMALIDDQPRSAEAKAHGGGAVVLEIPNEVVDGLLDPHKVSSLRLLKILCALVAKRLREISDKLVGWFIISGGESGD